MNRFGSYTFSKDLAELTESDLTPTQRKDSALLRKINERKKEVLNSRSASSTPLTERGYQDSSTFDLITDTLLATALIDSVSSVADSFFSSDSSSSSNDYSSSDSSSDYTSSDSSSFDTDFGSSD